MRFHDSPASSLRNSPPERLASSNSESRPPSSDSTTAYTTLGFLRQTSRPMRPVRLGRPLPSLRQVLPPSVLRQMPPLSPLPEYDQGVRSRAYIAA